MSAVQKAAPPVITWLGRALIVKNFGSARSFSFKVEIPEQGLSEILCGRRPANDGERTRIAKALDVPASELFSGDPRPLLTRLLERYGEQDVRKLASEGEIGRAVQKDVKL